MSHAGGTSGWRLQRSRNLRRISGRLPNDDVSDVPNHFVNILELSNVGEDLLDDCRDELEGKVVAHALEGHVASPGDRRCGCDTAARLDQGIVGPVDDEGSNLKCCEALGPIA